MDRNDHEMRALSDASASRREHDLRSISKAALANIRALMGASAPEPSSKEWRVFGDRLMLALDDARVDHARLFTDALREHLLQLCAQSLAHELTMVSSRLATILRYGARPLEAETDEGLLARVMRVTWPDRLLNANGLLAPKQREEFLAVFSRSAAAGEVIREGLNADDAVNLLMMKTVISELELDERYAQSPTATLCRMLVVEDETAADAEDDSEPVERPRG